MMLLEIDVMEVFLVLSTYFIDILLSILYKFLYLIRAI